MAEDLVKGKKDDISSKVSRIYSELLRFKLDLDLECIPAPSYIQERLIQCNEYQRKVEKYFIEITQNLSTKERMFRTEKLNIEMLRRQALVNNEKIKKLPTGKEREAAVDEILEEQYKELLSLENSVCMLKDVLSAIKTVQSNLKATNADIKVLVRVMEQQINRLNMGHPDDPEVKKIRKAFSEVDAFEKSLETDLEEEIDTEDVESLGCQETEGEDGSESDKVEPEANSTESSEDDDFDLSSVSAFLENDEPETNNNLSGSRDEDSAEDCPVPDDCELGSDFALPDSTDGESATNNNLSDSREEESSSTQEDQGGTEDDPISFMLDDLDSDGDEAEQNPPTESAPEKEQSKSKGLFDDEGYLLDEEPESKDMQEEKKSPSEEEGEGPEFSLDMLLNGDSGNTVSSEKSDSSEPVDEEQSAESSGRETDKGVSSEKGKSLEDAFFKDDDFDLNSILGI